MAKAVMSALCLAVLDIRSVTSKKEMTYERKTMALQILKASGFLRKVIVCSVWREKQTGINVIFAVY